MIFYLQTKTRRLNIFQIKFRKACLLDVDNIDLLLIDEVKRGNILHRDKSEISQNIRSYTLAIQTKNNNESIIGLSALHIHNQYLGEIRSLIVSPNFRNKGVGQEIIKSLIEEAKNIGLKEVLVLTFKAKLFETIGFTKENKENMPEQKIWQDCIKCKLFPKCEEILLIKHI